MQDHGGVAATWSPRTGDTAGLAPRAAVPGLAFTLNFEVLLSYKKNQNSSLESCDWNHVIPLTSPVLWAQQVLREPVQLPHTCPGKRDAILGHAPRPRPFLHPGCCSAGFRRVVVRLRPPEQRQH